jgi:hypothetical protein
MPCIETTLSYSIQVAIGKESRATSNNRSTSLPPGLGGLLDRRFMNALCNVGLFDGRLQSAWMEEITDCHVVK